MQRQIVAWWSAGSFDLPCPALAPLTPIDEKPLDEKTLDEKKPADAIRLAKPKSKRETDIDKVMRRDRKSRKEAVEYIENGGLDMEEYQREQNRPMHDALDAM